MYCSPKMEEGKNERVRGHNGYLRGQGRNISELGSRPVVHPYPALRYILIVQAQRIFAAHRTGRSRLGLSPPCNRHCNLLVSLFMFQSQVA